MTLLRKRKRTLWGRVKMVRPALVSRKFGDGKQLIRLSPINHRPNYYLVWIDDGMDIDSDEWLDALDGIYEEIEAEFGEYDEEEENPDGDPNLRDWAWPTADFSGGSAWGPADKKDHIEAAREIPEPKESEKP